jgi:hypothetical protein
MIRSSSRVPRAGRAAVAVAVVLVLASSALKADWLALKSGERLRGVDARAQGKRIRFTLEDGQDVLIDADRVAGIERESEEATVEFRGAQVKLREKVAALVRERKEREAARQKDLALWAGGGKESEAARERFRALAENERAASLARAVLESKDRGARRLAARELGGCEAGVAIPALAAAAVKDGYRSVRDQCLRTLKLFDDPGVAERFLPYLRSGAPDERTRAANALSVFPSLKAVPVLLDTMHMTWSGFGRGFFAQVTQRAYIADYELVSGGTGFSIIEVADPVVRTATTGVALDVDVRKVELISRLRALRRATGEDFGTDFDGWRRWWRDQGAAKATD